MKILLLGYGKMGKAIEEIALARKHTIAGRIRSHNHEDLYKLKSKDVDVAIEFSRPENAYANIKYCLENSIPVVCGTTGWLEKKQELDQLCRMKGGAFFYASNYSVGVNIFFHLNKILARIMDHYPHYKISLEEIHHTEKKDAPSGTAITLAEGILQHNHTKKSWVNQPADKPSELEIASKRIEKVPGTHTIFYESEVDTIEIRHTAHSRTGFAEGAVVASEWIQHKKGVFGMNDMLKINF